MLREPGVDGTKGRAGAHGREAAGDRHSMEARDVGDDDAVPARVARIAVAAGARDDVNRVLPSPANDAHHVLDALAVDDRARAQCVEAGVPEAARGVVVRVCRDDDVSVERLRKRGDGPVDVERPRQERERGGTRRAAEEVAAVHAADATHSLVDGATIISTMFRVEIDRGDPLELHEQVAAEIRRAIAAGEAKPGERLPPAKDLAAVLGVNTNTVLRALRQLRDEGLLEFRRGRGISVTGTPQRGVVVERARELVRYARTQGYKPDELIAIIEQLA